MGNCSGYWLFDHGNLGSGGGNWLGCMVWYVCGWVGRVCELDGILGCGKIGVLGFVEVRFLNFGFGGFGFLGFCGLKTGVIFGLFL